MEKFIISSSSVRQKVHLVHLLSLAPTNPRLTRVVDHGLFSL
jgi:hypothetical protein